MNFSIYRISLDIHKTATQLSFAARQGDTKRRLYISLVENSAPYEISEECYAIFSARKPDGTVIFNDCTIQDNMIIYDMTEQTTALVGRCECEIILYGYNNEMISSPRFAYTVYPSVGSEDIVVSTDEVTSLRTLITEANEAINRANNVKGSPGNSMVFRFSAYRDGTDFSETWNPGMLYMGIASVPHGEPAPTDKAAYEWTLFATNILELIPVTLSASAWVDGEQVVEAALIDESALFPSPKDDADVDAWVEYDLRLDRASLESMTFTCKQTPTVDIEVNVLVMLPTVSALPQVTKLENRVAEIERDHKDNTGFVNYLVNLAGNPENEGKTLMIRDEMYVAENIPSAGDGSASTGGGLPVVELSTKMTYCNAENPSTTTILSESESAALTEASEAMLPVIVKWSYDSLFPLCSLGNNLAGGHLELGAVYSSDTGAFVRGAVVRKGGTTWEFRLTWTDNA